MEENVNVPIQKKRRLWLIPVCCVLLLALGVAAFFLTADARQYAKAQALYERRSYLDAAELFESLGDYQDAAQQAIESRYARAGELLTRMKYAEALTLYEALGDYKNSAGKVMECSYNLGVEALEDKALDDAIAHFTRATDDYLDAQDQRLTAIYQRGHELFLQGEFDQAQTYFNQLVTDHPEYYIPHFVEPQEAIDYLKAITEPIEEITVVVENMSPFYENMIYWNAAVQQSMGYQFAEVTYDETQHAITLTPDYYPGQRIIWAWQSGDVSGLSEAELRTYEAAMALVEQAKAETDDTIGLELWLHDWICTHVEYDSPYTYVYPEDYVGLDELTCVGAILDGKANCQGYTDAFYLLGTLAGMEVHKVFGTSGEEGHCWNAVRLDGWLYTVDVTFDDTYCPEPNDMTYIWFNNALDMNAYTVSGGVSQFDKMVFLEDLSHTYYSRNNLVFEKLDEAVYQLLRRYRKNGKGLDYAVVDAVDLDDQDFYNAVARNMGTAGVYSAQWWVALEPYKEDTYITVWWE